MPSSTRSACASTKFRSPRTRCCARCTRRTGVWAPLHSRRFRIPSRRSCCRPGKAAMARRRSAMLRLPWFEHRAPRTVAEAAKILAGEGPRAMLIAGGTDLLPNMKRRHQAPKVLVSLRQVAELKAFSNGSGSVFGAGLTLNEVVHNEKTPGALRQAAAQVATPQLRNMGTLGGNLCL